MYSSSGLFASLSSVSLFCCYCCWARCCWGATFLSFCTVSCHTHWCFMLRRLVLYWSSARLFRSKCIYRFVYCSSKGKPTNEQQKSLRLNGFRCCSHIFSLSMRFFLLALGVCVCVHVCVFSHFYWWSKKNKRAKRIILHCIEPLIRLTLYTQSQKY